MSETLVVVSKVKKHIKEKEEMNCSSSFIDALSKVVEKACNEACQTAKSAKRKTVMDRDLSE